MLPMLIAIVASVSYAAAEGEHVLIFPKDRVVGTVQARWETGNYREVPWRPDHNGGWTILSNATKAVNVRNDTLLKLTLSGHDLNFLRDLDADDLFYLDCRFQELTNDDVTPIASLTGLRALDLSDNPGLTGAALGQLGALSNLEWLDFDRNSIADLPPGAIEQFPMLCSIAGHFKNYADDVLRQLGSLQDIEFICIKAGVVTEEGLRHLSGKTSLHGLVLDNVELTASALAALDAAPNLVYLDLRKNASLTDEALAKLAAFPSLRHVNLENCSITDAGVALLVDNPALEEVFLSNTQVTEACLESLAKLPVLHTIKLVETGVTETQAAGFVANLATRDGYAVPPQRSSNPRAPRIGIVMSHFTATGPHWIQRPYGYSNQVSSETARALDEANYDVFAVIEPGTEFMGELPGILRENGLTDKIVDGFDAGSLSQLDAVFLCACNNMKDEMLSALDTSIQQGLGMVRVGSFGNVTPGASDPRVEKLLGLQQAEFTWQGFRTSACPIVEKHAILGKLPVGATFVLNTLNGTRAEAGLVEGATLLIKAPSDYPETFPVLYVRDHGKGRIVNCQWHRPLQPGIPFPGYTYYIRALNWVSRRGENTVW
jgi:hypothetical protein